MILTTHALAGTIVASMIPNHPVLGFGLALASHYALDMIPHWEYKMRTESEDLNVIHKISWRDNNTYLDILTVKADALVGILLSVGFLLLIGGFNWYTLAVGVIAGVLPDFLQFAHIIHSHRPFRWTQKIHDFFHADIKWKHRPVLGTLTQVVSIIILIAVSSYLRK